MESRKPTKWDKARTVNDPLKEALYDLFVREGVFTPEQAVLEIEARYRADDGIATDPDDEACIRLIKECMARKNIPVNYLQQQASITRTHK
ncbi:MAG: hypothetical protein OXG05_14480 [Gammaproteobacteria bacterium]|nr:hypothetical protein [Gammaproteobacteria bacterium]